MKKEVVFFKTEKERRAFLRGKHNEIPAVEYVEEHAPKKKRKGRKKSDKEVQAD